MFASGSLVFGRHSMKETTAGKPSWMLLLGVCFLGGLFLQALPARALHPAPAQPTWVSCAVLEKFAGEVQILDYTRTKILPSTQKSTVPCGGWVSLETKPGAWASLKHRDGYVLRLSPGTYIELLEQNQAAKFMGDAIVLYRGSVYVEAGDGAPELRIVTANARARIDHAAALLVYSPKDEETQLITLENQASLENRFEASRRVRAKAGELTELNFSLRRVLPSMPQAISESSLQGRLAEVHLDEKKMNGFLAVARHRASRKFAANLDPDVEKYRKRRQLLSSQRKGVGSKARAPANHGSGRGELNPEVSQDMSEGQAHAEAATGTEAESSEDSNSGAEATTASQRGRGAGFAAVDDGEDGYSSRITAVDSTGEVEKKGAQRNLKALSRKGPAGKVNYARHDRMPDDGRIQERELSRLVGGAPDSEKLLFPGEVRADGRAGRAPASAQVHLNAKLRAVERIQADREKKERKRIIEELSKVSPD
jgi:hypothetical protein